MPKVTYEFNLPEEADEYKEHRCGPSYRRVLQELDNWLRNGLKHGSLDGTEYGAYEAIREEICDLLIEHGVSIHD